MEFSDIKGFGSKRTEALKAAGIDTPADLISYFPSRYIDTKNLTKLAAAEEGERVLVLACTHEQPKVAYVRRGLSVVKGKFVYDGATVWCSWFNQPFMAKNIVPERYYYITGKLKKHRSSFEIVAPQCIRFTGEEPPVISCYKPIGKVGSALIAGAVEAALGAVHVSGYIPDALTAKYGLTDIDGAFRAIHMPNSMAEVYAARRTLSLERLSYMLTAYSLIKSGEDERRLRTYRDARPELDAAVARLPYALTGAQKRSLDAIVDGLSSERRLNALLEGDVGCGKTVVAFLAMYYAALSGHQSALMAPTEILARQHYEKAIAFFEPLGVRCEFVGGSLGAKARATALFNIEYGNATIAVGTHALIEDDVKFADLSLVITDEQHRFGVAQRAKLESKAARADSIVMSATPIPRTLALTLYGDLTRLVIDELPSGRASITTRFVPPAKEEGMWRYIADRAAAGEQTYVVVPRISDEDDERTAAESMFDAHRRDFPDGTIALLHGRQSAQVKSATMSAFSAGKIKVLVATTVVEVGVDVPEATTMAIYDADRFGLAQLHQLRGRVGRGSKPSYCFVLTNSDSPETRERLERFVSCSDGFSLAEYDFRVRGAGDFLGYGQHGDGGFPTDPDTIALAKDLRDEMLSDPAALERVRASMTRSKYEFFVGITLN